MASIESYYRVSNNLPTAGNNPKSLLFSTEFEVQRQQFLEIA